MVERLAPGAWPSHDPQPEPCDAFDPDVFLQEDPEGGRPLVAGCVDGLVFAVPELLPTGAFRLQIGCRLALDRFDLISIAVEVERGQSGWR